METSLFDALSEWMGYPAYYTLYGGEPPARAGVRHGRTLGALEVVQRGAGIRQTVRRAAAVHPDPRGRIAFPQGNDIGPERPMSRDAAAPHDGRSEHRIDHGTSRKPELRCVSKEHAIRL